MNKLGDFLTRKFLEYQMEIGKPVYQRDFAAWLGVPPTSYSNWINAGFVPSLRYINLIADKLGPEVYDVLGMERPSPTIPLDVLPKELRDQLLSLVVELSSALGDLDRDSPEALEIVRTLMDKHGFNVKANSTRPLGEVK